MNVDKYASLCDRVITHCRQENWYGPDFFRLRSGKLRYSGYSYQQGRLEIREQTYDYRTGFEFPPATEEQLWMTEKVMGFAHPPLLRALYLRVANGGFGPGNGITGAFGGFCFRPGEDVRYTSLIRENIERTYGDQKWNDFSFIDLEHCEQRQGDPVCIRLGPGVWPTHFLHLCNWEIADASYLHARSGRVYLASPEYEVTLEGEEGFTLLSRQANSLEAWLERWLQGEQEPWEEALREEVRESLHQEVLRIQPDEDYQGEWGGSTKSMNRVEYQSQDGLIAS